MEKNLLILICFILLVSCTIAPMEKHKIEVYSFKAYDTNFYWHKGRQILSEEKEGITTNINFDRIDNNIIIFDAKFINKSDRNVLIDPDNMSCKFITTNEDTIKSIASEPEKVVLSFDIRKQRELNDYNSTNCIEAGFCLLGALVSDPAEEKTPAEEIREAEYRRSRDEEEKERRTEHIRIMEDIEKQRISFYQQVIRKTTLMPENSIEGKVLFPLPENSKNVHLIIKIDNCNYEFKMSKKTEETEIEVYKDIQFD